MANWRNRRSKFKNKNYTDNNNYEYVSSDYKRSGATFTKIQKGKMTGMWAVSAWKKNKLGMLKVSAMPLHDAPTEAGSGKQYVPYLVTIIDMNTLQATKYNGIMNFDTKVIAIRDLGYCISPNGDGKTQGGTRVKGYFGKFI